MPPSPVSSSWWAWPSSSAASGGKRKSTWVEIRRIVSLTDGVIRAGMRHGWRRGVVDGSSAWTAVAGLALIGYLAKRVLIRQPETVFSQILRPGEALRITHEDLS